jgi:putative chitinase
MTPQQLRKIMLHAPMQRLERFAAPLTEAMEEFSINTTARRAAFLAQVAHESGEFRYMEELANGEAYENNTDLQNDLPEAKAWAPDGKAGPWFKGHGPIQITGYKNHKRFGELLFPDDPETLLREPRRLCAVATGCRAAAAFFREEGCNEAADASDFLLVSQIVNVRPSQRGPGGRIPNGWAERQAYHARALAVEAEQVT